VVVIFGGAVVAEMSSVDADEPTLLRAAHNLKPGAPLPEQVAAEAAGTPDAVEAAIASAQE
jgi:hypothetical protein